MRKILQFLFLLFPCIFLLITSCEVEPGRELNFESRFIESDSSLFEIKAGQQYTFGYLKVPENRSNANGKSIKLPIYIFKSRGEQPKKDPIIYVVGGPGSSIMGAVPYMDYYQYLDDRDFILFEQRGTKYAQPHLACPEWSEAVFMANQPGVSDERSDSLYREAAVKCRDRLLADGIDLNAYNTDESAADIEDLRLALGIEKYNLLSLSYGTKIAQVLMRDYPSGLRSVVMDSPLPLEVNYDEQSLQNLFETYDKLFSDCEADEDCKKAFPKLKPRFYQFLRDITKEPLRIKVAHPDTGKEEHFFLKGKDLVNLLGFSSSGDIPYFPAVIETVLSGDFKLIEDQLRNLFKAPGNGEGRGMRLSVWCAEELPFASRAIISAESSKYPEVTGMSPTVFDPEICDIWGVESLTEKANQAVKSDIPVLIINGEYDNETPVKWGRQMLSNLENGHQLIFKGWHHTPTTYWNNPCGMQAANAFFNDPSKKPELDCLELIKEPDFITE